MFKKMRLILNFYKSYALISIGASAFCLFIIYINGLNTITALFWFKILMYGLIYFFINSYKNKELYYYKNLGASKKIMWISSLTLDFLIFVLLLTITLKYLI